MITSDICSRIDMGTVRTRLLTNMVGALLVLSVVVISGCTGGGADKADGRDSTLTGPTETKALPGIEIPSLPERNVSDIAAKIDSVSGISDAASPESLDRLAEAIMYLGSTIDAYTREMAQSTESTAVVRPPSKEIVQGYGLRIFWTIVVLTLTYFVVRGVTFILDVISEKNAERRLFFKRLVPIARVLIWSTAMYFILRTIFEVNGENLIAAAAAVGVAIGFAAQGIVKNVFGGFEIISDRPFQVGDKISVGGTYGEVTSIGLRSTRILTPDDSVVSVPNSYVIENQVSNANSGELDCQVVTNLYLPGHVDEALAKKIAFEAAASSRYVYLNKPIVVLVFDEFIETFLTHIKVKAYVLDTRLEFLLVSDITERARKGFREAGLLQSLHGARAYVDLTSLGKPDGMKASEARVNDSETDE